VTVSEALRVTAAELLEGDDGEWRAFLLSHPQALPYHHPAWVETLAEVYGYEPKAAVVRSPGGAVLGGLPLVAVGGRLRRRRWVSLPFTDFCPPLTADGVLERELASAVDALRRENEVASLEIRAPVEGFEERAEQRGVRHELVLTDPDTLFRSFRSQVRRNIRKAEASGLEVRVAEHRDELVRTYFDLHAETRRRLGVPPQPRRLFDGLWRNVMEPGLGFVLLAHHEGSAVAGAVFLEWKGRIVYKYGASDTRHWPLRPNNLLFWECIRRGCSSGATALDFGRSDLEDEGLRSFKQSWGAPEVPLAYTSIGRAASPSRSSGRVLRPLVRATPTWLSRTVGAALYRFVA
jgi:CelD/BcsL family acetyltransferase involved in cellulose biosynthesis